MGESVCLVRSFSHPTDRDSSRDSKEGDAAIRALGESVSFGRFMSESLAWEKWSTFSHNRYLEEVEKFSKPGSVAQKKAYFEAHYKKKAAEKAAAMLEDANMGTTIVSVVQTEDRSSIDSSVDSELVNENHHIVADEQQRKDVSNDEAFTYVDMNLCNPQLEKSVEEHSESKEAEIEVKQNKDSEKCTRVESSNQCENVEQQNQIMADPEENMPDKGPAGMEILRSAGKKRLVNSSSKLISQTRVSEIPSYPSKKAPSFQPRQKNDVTPKRKKLAGKITEKERVSANSVHMSINFAFRYGETRKATPVFQHNERTRVRTSPINESKESSTHQKSTNRLQASVNGSLKKSPLNTQLEDRRTKPLLSKSISGRLVVIGKPKSISEEMLSPCGSGSKTRSPTVSSPFRFASEERAAKRKEFFQKLEERTNGKEKEKEKAEYDAIKMRQSVGLKVKTYEDFCRRSQLHSNPYKIPLTRPRSPKLGRKPATSVVKDSSPLPPKALPSVNTDISKHVTRKNNPSTSRTSSSLAKHNARENASPNIQFI